MRVRNCDYTLTDVFDVEQAPTLIDSASPQLSIFPRQLVERLCEEAVTHLRVDDALVHRHHRLHVVQRNVDAGRTRTEAQLHRVLRTQVVPRSHNGNCGR